MTNQRNTRKSLNQQISLANRQLLHDQRRVTASSSLLFRALQRKLTSPVSLLLAGACGYICGEFSLCRPVTSCVEGERATTSKTTLWSMAFNAIRRIFKLIAL